MRIAICLLALLVFSGCSMTGRANIENPILVVKPIAINSQDKEVEAKYRAYIVIIGGHLSHCDHLVKRSYGIKAQIGDLVVVDYLALLSDAEGKLYPMTVMNEDYRPNRKYVGKDKINVRGLLEGGEAFSELPRGEKQSDKELIEGLLQKTLM